MLSTRPLGTPRCRTVLWVALIVLAGAAARASADGTGAAAGPSRAELDRQIAEIDALLAEAHFRTALSLTRATLNRLPSASTRPEEASRRARLNVMAATAQIALGQRPLAGLLLERALRADPTLVFDDKEFSPKLVELVAEARRRSGAAEARP
jgi:hypothetical protein